MKLRSSALLAVITVLVTSVNVQSCQPNQVVDEQPQNGGWQDISDYGLPTYRGFPKVAQAPVVFEPESDAAQEEQSQSNSRAIQAVVVDNNAQMAADRIVESLSINKARIAAQHSNLCPKLITSQIDSNQIVRKQEVLQGNYCDYYLYPLKGQQISVESHPSTIHASLISPVRHDFANGSFFVDRADKYTIRLDYKGSEYRNTPMDYDVVVTIE